MSDTSFRVDTVPTPRLDLYGALTKDLQYYMQNKQTLPPSPRSALAAEQEKINKFMQYVNESFIIKGFSKYNPVPEQAVDSDVTAVYNDETKTFAQSFVPIARFTLQCKYVSHLYVHWALAGDFRRADGVAEGDGRLQVQLFINNQSEGLWQQDLAPGKRQPVPGAVFAKQNRRKLRPSRCWPGWTWEACKFRPAAPTPPAMPSLRPRNNKVWEGKTHGKLR